MLDVGWPLIKQSVMGVGSARHWLIVLQDKVDRGRLCLMLLDLFWKPRVMFKLHARRWLRNLHTLWSMRGVHDRCRLSNVQAIAHAGRPRLKSAVRGVYAKADVGILCLMTIERFALSTVDPAGPCLTDVQRNILCGSLWPISPGQCRFFYWLMSPNADIPLLMLPAVCRHWYRSADPHTPRHMLPAIGHCRLHEVHDPWMMLHNIGRGEYHPADAYRPRQLCAGLCWFFF